MSFGSKIIFKKTKEILFSQVHTMYAKNSKYKMRNPRYYQLIIIFIQLQI